MIKKMILNTKNPLKGTVYVEFDNHEVGKKAIQNQDFRNQTYVPIQADSVTFSFGNLKVTRCQYPFTLAWASTIHKVQGQTVDTIVASFSSRSFNCGQAYVALSRVRSLAGLFLLSFDPKKIRSNKKAVKEMERLRENMSLSWVEATQLPKQEGEISIVHLNIRSLVLHHHHLAKQTSIIGCDIVCLTETKTGTSEHLPFFLDHVACSLQSPHGIVCYSLDFILN